MARASQESAEKERSVSSRVTWAGRQFWAQAMVTAAGEASAARVAAGSQDRFSSSMMRPLMTRLSVMPPMKVRSATFPKNAGSQRRAPSRLVVAPVTRTDTSPGAAAQMPARNRAAGVSASSGAPAPR